MGDTQPWDSHGGSMARAAGWELSPWAGSQEAAGGREMLPPGLEEEMLHHTGTDGLGTGPWMHNPKARASLCIPRLQEQGLAPAETE